MRFIILYTHLDVGSCPCYPYRRLTQGSKVFPDPAKADERITLNLIICEIHSHIETFKCKMLTKVWNGINSFIVYRISSSAVAPSLFICTHIDVHYVPRRKEHKGIFFSSLFCLLLFGGRKCDLWHAEEHRARGRCGALSPMSPPPPTPQLLFSPHYNFLCTFWETHLVGVPLQALELFLPSPLDPDALCGRRKLLFNLRVCFCLSLAELDPVPQAHPNAGAHLPCWASGDNSGSLINPGPELTSTKMRIVPVKSLCVSLK